MFKEIAAVTQSTFNLYFIFLIRLLVCITGNMGEKALVSSGYSKLEMNFV